MVENGSFDCLHLGEVEVHGFLAEGSPTVAPTSAITAFPTPAWTNVAFGKVTNQSSTYDTNQQVGPDMAVDGVYSTQTHTKCGEGYKQWWRVDLGDSYIVESMKIVNRVPGYEFRYVLSR